MSDCRRLFQALPPLLILLFCAFARAESVPGGPTEPAAQGLALFRSGELQKAEPLLRDALKKSPDQLEVVLALAQVHLARDDYAGAIPLAERAVAVAPDSSKAHEVLGDSYAIKAMKVSKVRAMFFVGDIRREYERAISLDPKNLGARLGLVQWYLSVPGVAGGSKDEARKQAEEVVLLDPIQGLTMVATIAHAQGKDADALGAVDRLAKVDSGRAHLLRAQSSAQKKDTARAAEEYLKVGTEDPEDANDLTSAAIGLQDLKRWDDALSLLEKAAAADPTYMMAVYQVGRTCLFAGKDLARAEASFKRYLGTEPKAGSPPHAAAHWRLGMVYQAMGRTADARKEYEESLRLNPDDKDVKESIASLK